MHEERREGRAGSGVNWWGEEGARSRVRSGNRRGEDAGVSAHTNMVAKQCPNKGQDFGVQTSGSIGDVRDKANGGTR